MLESIANDAASAMIDALLRREARLRALSAEVAELRAMIGRDRPTHEWRGASSAAFEVGLDALITTLARASDALSTGADHTRRARLAVADGG